jgi:hypothetical protein
MDEIQGGGDRLEKEERGPGFEPRWPVVLAILTALLLLVMLPGRIRLFPLWVPYIIAVGGVAPIVVVSVAREKERWLRVERGVTLLVGVVIACVTAASLGQLTFALVHRSGEVGGTALLASSVAVWVDNVLAFSLLYWQIDRGGPAARARGAGSRPDWIFPQEGAPDANGPAGWRPAYVDYMFLGFTTATAFSPTDTLPLTPRAKMLMMLESSISLGTIVLVAARAINILGS